MQTLENALTAFPGWFALRGHAGLFRIDDLKSSSDSIVLAGMNGREVGRCSLAELQANVDGESRRLSPA
ncbi:MAG TPA: hypothetical protein VHR97_14165 [Candidatus Baltobacteraceae bacterium]|jgi:hypothetical protein|nr:hypothetical protein [Candidatus Baltobacteraceae bacterium]